MLENPGWPKQAPGTPWPAWFVCLLFSCFSCLSWFLFFYGLADRDLWSSHEARAAQDAQTILDDGAWGLPHLFDGKPELQKPPLYYWLVAGIGGLRGGVDAWAVRLPAALAGLGGVLVLFVLGVRQGRPLAGFLAAGTLATCLHYTWLARTGRIDLPLTFTVAIALVSFYLGRLWLFYVALAGAVLLKGPIGFVLPVAVLAVHLAVEGRLPAPWHVRRWGRLVRETGAWWGVPVVLALTVPWFVWANVQTDGEFARSFFWKHNFQRGLGGSSDLASHPWWFYVPRAAFDLLPWSAVLPMLLWIQRRGWWPEDREARFGLVWFLTVFAVLSCTSFKRADYLLPAYPGLALCVGCLAERWLRPQQAMRAKVVIATVVLGWCVVTAGWCGYVEWVLPQREPEYEQRRFAAAIRDYAPAPRQILLFRTEAHALAFHLGRPVATLLEWENLDIWASSPETTYVVMPPDAARQWPEYVRSGRLEEVLRNTDLTGGRHAKPLVLLRTRPVSEPSVRPVRAADARAAATAADCPGPAQRGAAGPQPADPRGGSAAELADLPGRSATGLRAAARR